MFNKILIITILILIVQQNIDINDYFNGILILTILSFNSLIKYWY